MNAASGPNRGAQRAIFRSLFDLAMPIVGLNVLSVLTLAVDTAMCGRLVDAEEALTALGFAGQLIFLLMVAMLGLTVGTVAFIARAHGAGKTERVNHVLHQSILLTYVVSIGVAIVGNLGAGAAMDLLGADPAVRDLGVDYLRPLVGFTVFFYLNMLFAAALRAVGNTMLPFMIALFSNFLNIVRVWGAGASSFGADRPPACERSLSRRSACCARYAGPQRGVPIRRRDAGARGAGGRGSTRHWSAHSVFGVRA